MTDTVAEFDEQMSAEDMKELIKEAPPQSPDQAKSDEIPPVSPRDPVTNEAIRAAASGESKPKAEIVDKPAVNVNKPSAIGAAAPSDNNIILPKSVSGEKEVKDRRAAADKPTAKKEQSPFRYIDPIQEIINGNRNPDGTYKIGSPQQTNKNGTAGRPTVMDDQTLLKLQAAFCMGCSDLEACQFAGISKSTLYYYQNDHPEFLEQKEVWKENPILKARASVYNGIAYDADLALKFLERKKKDEFSLRTEHTGKDGGPIESVLDRVESNYDELADNAAAAINAVTSNNPATPGETEK